MGTEIEAGWGQLTEMEAKAFGRHGRFFSNPLLSKVGRPNPQVKQSVDHGFLTLQGQYRAKLKLFLSTEGNIRKKQDAAFELVFGYFQKAFRRGLLSQAGLKSTPRNLDISIDSLRWLNQAAKEEVTYLIRFFRDYDGISPAKAEFRREMYVKTLESMFIAGKVTAVPKGKLTIIHWVIDRKAESCVGCIYLSKMSPFTKESLPCVPKDGSTPCLSFCKCKLRFQTVDAATYNKVYRTWTSKRQHLARLGSFK